MNASCSRLALLALLASATAAADSDDDAYERTYRRGLTEFEAQHWTTARADFEAAYAIDPQPRLLVNIGSTYRRDGNAARAVAYYERFLAEAALDDPGRDEVTELIARLRAEPGEPPETPAPTHGTPTLRTVGWIGTIAGAAVLAYAGVETYVAYDAAGELRQRAANHDAWSPALQARLDTAKERAIIGAAGGGALVALGIGLVLTHRIDDKELVVARPTGGWSVAVSGKF